TSPSRAVRSPTAPRPGSAQRHRRVHLLRSALAWAGQQSALARAGQCTDIMGRAGPPPEWNSQKEPSATLRVEAGDFLLTGKRRRLPPGKRRRGAQTRSEEDTSERQSRG